MEESKELQVQTNPTFPCSANQVSSKFISMDTGNGSCWKSYPDELERKHKKSYFKKCIQKDFWTRIYA